MASPSPASSKRKRRSWLTWLGVAAAALIAAGFIFGKPLLRATRGAVASHYARAAADMIEKEDWPAAMRHINVARRWSPDSPEALRALADFMVKVKADAFATHQLLVRLADLNLATPSDRLLIAEFQFSQADLVRARASLQALPESVRQQRRAQELLANILRAEGRAAESEQVMRQALMAEPDDPAAQYRLALLDYQTPFPELRAQARDRIWSLTESQNDTARQAIMFLADEPTLTLAQAENLLKRAESLPQSSPSLRLEVLSAILRLQPAMRERTIEAELAQFDLEAGSSTEALLQWLIDEKEHRRVLKLLPVEPGKSRNLLEFRLKALAGEGRWEDIQDLFQKHKDLPLPMEVAGLWQAKASHYLRSDPARTQRLLLSAYNAAGMGEKGEATLELARFAEECGLWKVAATCYNGIARIHPAAQIRMLEKVHEMALRDRDTATALSSSRTLVEQNPANVIFSRRLAYFQLLAGDEIELAIARCQAGASHSENHPSTTLVRALAAFRIGDTATMKEQLTHVSNLELLSSGERAVYAGLLAAGGDPSLAYQVGEKLPAALLLPEELELLKRAL